MRFSIQRLYRNHVMVLCVLFAATLTVILVITSYFEQRLSRRILLDTQAKMVAATLGNHEDLDPYGAEIALQTLSSNSYLVLGCVLNNNAVSVASYRGQSAKNSVFAELDCGKATQADNGLALQRVMVDVVRAKLPEPMGKIVLLSEPPSPLDHIGAWLTIGLLMTLVLALGFWLFGERLKQVVLQPLRRIASTAQRVSLYKDYTLRVVPGALEVVPDEVQGLTDSFNAMLKEIEDRDGRLSRKSAELDRARKAAESASQAKSQFLANVSHELRTPLNAIIGFSSILADEQFGPLGNEKYTNYARDIQESGKHLLDVINDILDLSKAETGRLAVNFASVSLPKVIDKALRIIAGHAQNRKIDIYTDIPEKMPKLIADPVRLIQILLNLLSNAIKFSHEGGKIYVRVRVEQGRQGIYYFTLIVEDQGIGMTTAELSKVFSSFNQAETGLNRKYEGAGLGLPLTKRLVELHHGKIKIESVSGQGTIVTVRLTSDPALLD